MLGLAFNKSWARSQFPGRWLVETKFSSSLIGWNGLPDHPFIQWLFSITKNLHKISSSHFGTIFSRSTLKSFHSSPPFLLPLKNDAILLHDDCSSAIWVITKNKICWSRANLWTTAFMVLLADPKFQGTSLLHIPNLVGSSKGRIKTGLKLKPLSVISNLSSDIDKKHVILSAVFSHVDFSCCFCTLTTAYSCVMLRVGAVVLGSATRGALVWSIGAIGASPSRSCRHTRPWHLDTRCYRRSWLLVSLGTPITLLSRDAILTRALTISLVTDFSTGTHGVTITGFTSFLMGHGVLFVAVVALFAVMTVSSSSVVSAFVANTSGNASWKSEKLHVEPASPGMEIAVARFALICLVLSGSAPWSIKMEWFALFTLSAVSIVLTVACQVSVFVPVIRDDNGARKIRKTILLMF